METMVAVGGFCVVHLAVMYGLGRIVYSTSQSLRSRETILSMGTIFYNAGNYGIPLTLLAFGREQIGVIAVILIVQNFLSFSIGISFLERDKNAGKLLGSLARVPTIQAILLAVVLRLLNFDLTRVEPLAQPIRFLADGLIPVALLTLGAQLSRSRIGDTKSPLVAVSAMRLLVSPLVAAALILVFRRLHPIFDFQPPVSSILIVAAGLPVAVNVAILAGVYKNDEDLASQAVFWTTLLSALTITALLLLTGRQ